MRPLGVFAFLACDRIWPDPPVVVKEQTDTVKVIHAMSPFPADSERGNAEEISFI